jgi:AraC-like DNA-binding protein
MKVEAPIGNTVALISFVREVSHAQLQPNYWAEKGNKFIDEHYARLFGMEDICSHLGISASYFRDVFVNTFNIAPKPYLTLVKIQRAQVFLRDSSRKVSEIAIMAGFRHRSAFERAFKRLVGVSPTEFRKLSSTGDFDTRI